MKKYYSHVDRLMAHGVIGFEGDFQLYQLDNKSIHFIYQPYEIAPFATGTIDIFVPGKFE